MTEQPNVPDNQPSSRSDPPTDNDTDSGFTTDAASWGGSQPAADGPDPTVDAATWTRQQEPPATPPMVTPDAASPGAVTPHDAATAGRPAGAPVATGEQMKRRHPVAVWIGLPLITLGVYHFVWYYKIHRELRDYDRREPVPTVGPVLVLIFLSWTVIGPLISYYRTGVWIAKSQRAAGMPETCVPLFGMLLLLVFGLGTLYFQMELNKVVDRYGGSATPPGTTVPLYA
jgi:hypothetical protein